MKKTFIKTIVREIKGSFGRFAAIFAIVALGVGFLAGLLATTPDMKSSVDRYYDDYNMADVFIKATMGLTDADLKTVSEIEEVKQIMPAYVTDVLTDINANEILPTRVYGLSTQFFEKSTSGINQLKLIKGKMPQAENECVVEQLGGSLSAIELGSVIRILDENEDSDNIGDTYKNTEFTVVGVVSNPFYFSYEKERTNIGNGRIGAIIYVFGSNYALDVNTDFLITVEGASELTAFTENYEATVDNVVEKLESLGYIRSEIRYREVVSEANDKIEEAKIEYQDGKKEAETDLNDAWLEIEDGKKELLDAKVEIEDGQKEIADAKNTLKREITDANNEIKDAKQELKDALVELEDGEKKLADAIAELDDGKRKYDEGYLEYLEGIEEISKADKEFKKGELEYEDGVKELAEAKNKIADAERSLAYAQQNLQTGEYQYQDGLKQYNANKDQFDQLMSQVLNGLSAGKLSFANSQELFMAMEQDTTGEISLAVTNVLTNMRSNMQLQIDSINALQTEANELEAYISTLENSVPVTPDAITIDEASAKLAQLKAEYEKQKHNIEPLNRALASLPPDSDTLKKSYYQLNSAKASLENARAQLTNGWISFSRGHEELKEGKKRYEEGIVELEKAKTELEINRQKLDDARDELKNARIELEDAKLEIKDGDKEISDARKELDDGWKEYYDGLVKITEAEETLKKETSDAGRKIRDAEEELAEGQIDYEEGFIEIADGESKYLEAKADVEKELADAAKEITDAEEDLKELEMPEWYVLDRNSNISYISFSMNADKVGAIATVFPVFFYLVAALVTLTTMTRMVEKERTQIGTLKALGYTKGIIMSKYLVYCGLASISGSIAGLLMGFNILPNIIWTAYGMLYHLPALNAAFMWEYAISSSVIAVFCTMAATVNACHHTLKEKPASLMLPKAPKAGKHILLERITFIWSRMKFSYKATARNIFRYKKHFFMTVIGIAGCTALMVAGFGVNDSIKDIAHTQFEDIMRYQLRVELDTKEAFDDILNDFLNDSSKVIGYTEVLITEGTIDQNGESFELSIISPKIGSELHGFIDLRNRKTGEAIKLDNDSVILAEKLADSLGLKKGDKIAVENADEKIAELIITDLCENYVGSYIYLTQASYANYFDTEPIANTILVKSQFTEDLQDDAISEILLSEAVSNAEFISQIQKTYTNLLSSIGFIVIVLVIAAGALAVIVLYNLINININERNTELATLKVLGYHNNEVAGYVFRETIILSIVGTIVGLVLGTILHRFIVAVAENYNLMFGRQISPQSFILSALATLLFSLSVNLVMYGKLKKIEMVDSMKAVD